MSFLNKPALIMIIQRPEKLQPKDTLNFQFTKVNDVFHDDSWFFLFAHDIEAEILYTKLSWNGFRMQRGVQYIGGGSKQVIKSISHDLSPCDTEKIGIEKACHETKVCSL